MSLFKINSTFQKKKNLDIKMFVTCKYSELLQYWPTYFIKRTWKRNFITTKVVKSKINCIEQKMHEIKENRSLFEKLIFASLCRFYLSKILLNSNIQADSQFFVSLSECVSMSWTNHDFAWFFSFSPISDYACPYEKKTLPYLNFVFLVACSNSISHSVSPSIGPLVRWL